MVRWFKELFSKGPANAEKSLLGCLVANVLLVLIIGVAAWLFGAKLVLFHGR